MQVNIRINDKLYEKLRQLAKKEHRTITAQLDIILSNALDTSEEKTIEVPEKQLSNIIDIKENDLW